MAGIDSNTLFLLRGDSFSDSSYRNAIINRTGSMGDAQIVDEVIDGKEIKCIYFNTTGYFTANIDSTFLKRPFCIDWWEKDYGVTSNTSGASLLCNMLSSGNYSFGLSSWSSSRNCISMSTGGSSYNIANVVHIGATKTQEWVHRAVEFTGSAYNFYENGNYIKGGSFYVCEQNQPLACAFLAAAASSLLQASSLVWSEISKPRSVVFSGKVNSFAKRDISP